MKRLFLQTSLLLILLTCSPLVTNSYAEIIVGNSLEWLTVSSKVVAVGRITHVEKSKGEGSVVYETYVFEPSEIIKGSKQKSISFTVRTFSTEPVFGSLIDNTNEIVVFLSPYKERDGEKFLRGKLIPTSTSFPLSIINLNNPSKYVIDLNFRVLNNKEDILKVCRQTEKTQTEYVEQHPSFPIKGFYLEVPFDTEAHESLFAGSSCYLLVPNFMSAKSKEKLF
ncbi:MAG: hypothetical protein ACR2GW_12160 [Pyrinomonadaceae bacterium]